MYLNRLFIPSDFGDAEIDVLVKHFTPVLANPEKICDQWTMLKTRLFLEHTSLQNLTWPDVGRMHSDSCQEVLNLMDLIQTIPVGTADCERGFNVMKMVKSDWRSRLDANTLSDLLVVQLTSPDIPDYDPAPAVELWHSDCIRRHRPDFLDGHEAEVLYSVGDDDID